MVRSFVAAGIVLAAASFASLPAFAADTPPTVAIFQKARQEVRSAKWADALATLERLDAESRKPGMEAERMKLEPSMHFLKGVCEASLDRREDALADFGRFLETSPNASLDPAAYPKKAYALFEEAKRAAMPPAASAVASSVRPASGLPSLNEAYERFRPDARPAGDGGEDWANGPVRYLMTDTERGAWERASDAASRSEVVTRFWAVRDPTPATPENEFRTEFERRVAFADATLGDGERRGSLTDRGRVFVLLGPPTWLGRSALSAADDASDVRPNTASKVLDTQENYRETWHYRRDRLPGTVPFQQVDFTFVTRRGYGTHVLQRDANALATLDAARAPHRI